LKHPQKYIKREKKEKVNKRIKWAEEGHPESIGYRQKSIPAVYEKFLDRAPEQNELCKD
jgi:hypothetical protein